MLLLLTDGPATSFIDLDNGNAFLLLLRRRQEERKECEEKTRQKGEYLFPWKNTHSKAPVSIIGWQKKIKERRERERERERESGAKKKEEEDEKEKENQRSKTKGGDETMKDLWRTLMVERISVW